MVNAVFIYFVIFISQMFLSMSLALLPSEQLIYLKKLLQAKSLSHISESNGILKSDGLETIKPFNSCS